MNLGQWKKQLWKQQEDVGELYNMTKKHQKTFWKDPCFPASQLYIAHCTSPHTHTHTFVQCSKREVRAHTTRGHTYFPFFTTLLHCSGLPSMFVLIDFCGVRSFWTAADRPAIHLEFKECSGQSVSLLFVLHRMTTSSGTLPCQQRGWQGS